jgi:glucose-1-phosphate thymidylyltransferase
MKGLILAGGAGTRLRPLTYNGAKQLVPVANRPILFYVIDALVEAGVRDIAIVVAPETAGEIAACTGDGSAWGATVTYVAQSRPLGLAHAVTMARAFLGDSDFCMFLGDNLLGMPLGPSIDAFARAPELAASLMLKEVPHPERFGVAEVDADGNVVRLAEKPTEPKSNLALVGVYLFRAAVHDAIAEIQPSARGELEITDAIGKLIDRGARVRFERVASWWLDTGKNDDLLLANATVLDAWLVHDVRGAVDAESRLTGRVRVEEGARVIRSVIRGPVAIGKGATIVDSRVGPFSSIGPGATIERSGVERCVILEQSHVVDVERVEDSLLGRRVRVQGGAAGHGALSLLVGDDARVEVGRTP